jgi:hypothetical protein
VEGDFSYGLIPNYPVKDKKVEAIFENRQEIE